MLSLVAVELRAYTAWAGDKGDAVLWAQISGNTFLKDKTFLLATIRRRGYCLLFSLLSFFSSINPERKLSVLFS